MRQMDRTASFFLRNCPDAEKGGEGDGFPSEPQW